MFKIVGSLPVKTRLPLKAWVLAGLVTLFSLATALMHVGQPTVQAANSAMHYASVADLISFFSAL
jgi:hypothetical protein